MHISARRWALAAAWLAAGAIAFLALALLALAFPSATVWTYFPAVGWTETRFRLLVPGLPALSLALLSWFARPWWTPAVGVVLATAGAVAFWPRTTCPPETFCEGPGELFVLPFIAFACLYGCMLGLLARGARRLLRRPA